jgi:hypothetical protein
MKTELIIRTLAKSWLADETIMKYSLAEPSWNEFNFKQFVEYYGLHDSINIYPIFVEVITPMLFSEINKQK